MESTARGSNLKTIVPWLPNEIIIQIIQAVPRCADRGVLCRTSRRFHSLSAPVLYWSVELRTPVSIVAFCFAVLSNSALAELVRSFTVVETLHLHYFVLLPDQIVDAIKTLVNLEDVSIPITFMSEGNLSELLRWTFPHLVRCSLGSRAARWSSTEQEDTLASFLLRHRALKTLHVQDWAVLPETWPSGSARIPLLHLEHLRCPGEVIPVIATNSLKEARIYWMEDEPNDTEGIFLALRSMARTDIPFVCSNDACDDCFPEIVNFLSRNIPHTKTLHLQMHNIYADRGKIDDLKEYLPRFAGLVFFWIESSVGPGAWGPEAEGPITHRDFVDACPSLEACCIYFHAWRKVGGMWEVFPVENFKELSGITLR
ncbi:hypothetical protein FB451DRAFT_1257848 [Mycena latifolia]|nr:hypothetical protein FB451DRAFT_1257848 [Mycena latifolia]